MNKMSLLEKIEIISSHIDGTWLAIINDENSEPLPFALNTVFQEKENMKQIEEGHC